LQGVARQWNVKKHASRSFNVGPVGILYMGYHATDIQLDGSRSQLLNVFSAGNLCARVDTLSVRGSLPYGGSLSIYSNIGKLEDALPSPSSLRTPPFSSRCVPSSDDETLSRSTSFSMLLSLLVSIDSPSLFPRTPVA